MYLAWLCVSCRRCTIETDGLLLWTVSLVNDLVTFTPTFLRPGTSSNQRPHTSKSVDVRSKTGRFLTFLELKTGVLYGLMCMERLSVAYTIFYGTLGATVKVESDKIIIHRMHRVKRCIVFVKCCLK